MNYDTDSNIYCSIDNVLTDRLDNPSPAVRKRAARDIADASKAQDMVRDLVHALGDDDPEVVESITGALAKIAEGRPEVVAKLVRLLKHPEPPSVPRLASVLLRIGTPQALEGAISALDAAAPYQDLGEVFDVLAGAAAIPDSRFEVMLDGRREDRRQWGAEILSRRGVARANEVLVGRFASRAVVDRFVAFGPEGIRALCRAAAATDDRFAFQIVSDRLAARRTRTAAAIYEIADDAAGGGDSVAACVLGHWDEPRSVEVLLRIADDPARSPEAREAAREALCTIEAPEAIDLLGRAMLDPAIDKQDREHYAVTLGEIGNYAALGAEHLEAAAKADWRGIVGKAARKAMRRIGG